LAFTGSCQGHGVVGVARRRRKRAALGLEERLKE